jgi:hypothetical protein
MRRCRILSIAVILLACLLGAPTSFGQVPPPGVSRDPCPEPNDALTAGCQLAQPTAMGTTIQGLFHSPSDRDAYRFEVPPPGATAYLTLSDLWYEGSLALFDLTRGGLVAESDRQGQTQGQLLAPEVIIRWLEPGSYVAVVSAGVDNWEAAEAHSYTLRVALGPAIAPAAGEGPAPSSARGYHLTLAIEPSSPSVFSLMTFTATLNPPFTDLFDFSWTVDGQPFGENSNVVQLPRPSPGRHTVVVVARGARYYPDLSLPEFPPTLSATGSFQVP